MMRRLLHPVLFCFVLYTDTDRLRYCAAVTASVQLTTHKPLLYSSGQRERALLSLLSTFFLSFLWERRRVDMRQKDMEFLQLVHWLW
ncbi:hypothetical protein B0T09DRAFT_59320 [Sordaria sp. MPI-SDFR-AT-0083]|nr:hypothetical protein B0T09DRAFT_59320 [Sordaria sp. MPI-SDFR-AT-0083]